MVVDDYPGFTWTIFLKFKSETGDVLMNFYKMIQTKLNYLIAEIMCDHETEFEK